MTHLKSYLETLKYSSLQIAREMGGYKEDVLYTLTQTQINIHKRRVKGQALESYIDAKNHKPTINVYTPIRTKHISRIFGKKMRHISQMDYHIIGVLYGELQNYQGRSSEAAVIQYEMAKFRGRTSHKWKIAASLFPKEIKEGARLKKINKGS